MYQGLKSPSLRLVSIAVIFLIASLVLTSGCSIWPFGKRDTAKEASDLKNKTDKIFTTVQRHSKDFDAFLKKLNKRFYTAKDAQEFANSLSKFQGQVKQDLNSLKELKEKLLLLTELDKEKRFTKYIEVTSKASASLDKALINSQNIVTALSSKYSELANLFSAIDKIKQEQSRYIVALNAESTRKVQAALSKMLADRALLTSTTESQTSTETSTETSSEDQSNTSTDSNNSDEEGTNTATETSSSSSTSSGSSGDLDQWVYIISQNTWPSAYIKDFVQEAADSFNKLYIDVYQIHKKVAFKNSSQLKDYLQEIKDDVADYASNIEAVIDNLKEQKRLTALKERDTKILASMKATHDYATLAQASRPAAVSGQSVASKGFSWIHDLAHKERTRYENKIKSYNERLKNLNNNLKGTLNSQYEEASWRFSGSLLALYKVNMKINRNLMREIKSWKKKAIAKYVFLRLEHLAEAKQQNYQANKAYIEAKNKIASK